MIHDQVGIKPLPRNLRGQELDAVPPAAIAHATERRTPAELGLNGPCLR